MEYVRNNSSNFVRQDFVDINLAAQREKMKSGMVKMKMSKENNGRNLKRKINEAFEGPPSKEGRFAFAENPKAEKVQKNALSTLHEMFRSLNIKIISQEGPTNAPIFTAAIEINGLLFTGQGRNKKLAKHAAAEAALKSVVQLKNPVNEPPIFDTTQNSDFSDDAVYRDVNNFDVLPTTENNSNVPNVEPDNSTSNNHNNDPSIDNGSNQNNDPSNDNGSNQNNDPSNDNDSNQNKDPGQDSCNNQQSNHNDHPQGGEVKKPRKKSVVMSQTVGGSVYSKNPVMLLNEIHPSARYELLSESGTQSAKYTMAVYINDQRFEGRGSSKKLSKAAAARCALSIFYNVVVPETPVVPVELLVPTDSTTLPQKFADHVAQLVVDKFETLVPRFSILYRRKVLAGFVLSENYELGNCRVITISTGTKCVSGEKMSVNGTVLNDSHAEILSRRGLCGFLYKELEKLADENAKNDSIFEAKEGGGFKLKSKYKFHLFINTAPCGDARIFSPYDISLTDKHPNRKARGQLRTKIECGEGTIPVKSFLGIQTWDGVLLGERLLTMSCSDKIAKWNVVGLQGALLSNFIDPIYLDSIILGSLFHPCHLLRAVCGRIEKNISGLGPPYRLNKPRLSGTVNTEKRQTGKAPNMSINWAVGEKCIEVINAVTGRTDQNTISRISKCKLFYKFLKLLDKIPTTTGLTKSEGPSLYSFCKESAHGFQAAKKVLFKAMVKTELGDWVKKPMEVDQFEWDVESLDKLFQTDAANAVVSNTLSLELNSGRCE